MTTAIMKGDIFGNKTVISDFQSARNIKSHIVSNAGIASDVNLRQYFSDIAKNKNDFSVYSDPVSYENFSFSYYIGQEGVSAKILTYLFTKSIENWGNPKNPIKPIIKISNRTRQKPYG